MGYSKYTDRNCRRTRLHNLLLVFDDRYSIPAWIGAGYIPPTPTGEGATAFTGVARPWGLPFLTAAGGLLIGLIVFRFAPEAKGTGHDDIINAFHKPYVARKVDLSDVQEFIEVQSPIASHYSLY